MLLRAPPHRILQAVVAHFTFDQVRDDFRVRFGLELVALRLELVLQIEIVLDDAVVDDDDAAGAVTVRMRVLLRRPAVRRPSRVADAVRAVDRIDADRLFRDSQACPLTGAARSPRG